MKKKKEERKEKREERKKKREKREKRKETLSTISFGLRSLIIISTFPIKSSLNSPKKIKIKHKYIKTI